jgi:hypothetical protein
VAIFAALAFVPLRGATRKSRRSSAGDLVVESTLVTIRGELLRGAIGVGIVAIGAALVGSDVLVLFGGMLFGTGLGAGLSAVVVVRRERKANVLFLRVIPRWRWRLDRGDVVTVTRTSAPT